MELDKAQSYPGSGPKTTPTIRKHALVTDDHEELEVRPKNQNTDDTDDEWESVETSDKENSPVAKWMWVGVGVFLLAFGAMAILIVLALKPSIPPSAANSPASVAMNTGPANGTNSQPGVINPKLP
jgi:hypothetical protein